VHDAVSKLIGDGKIEGATVNEKAKGSSFETKPIQVDGAAKNDISLTPPPSGPMTPGGMVPYMGTLDLISVKM